MRYYGLSSCSSALTAEHDENVMRKAFTRSEQVAIADAIAEKLAGRNQRPDKSGNISLVTDVGRTTDILKNVGLRSTCWRSVGWSLILLNGSTYLVCKDYRVNLR